jgi:hypothetical protein
MNRVTTEYYSTIKINEEENYGKNEESLNTYC